MKGLHWTEKLPCIYGITKRWTWKRSVGTFFNQIIFMQRKINSLGVCELFPNHTCQVRGKLRLKHQSFLYCTTVLVCKSRCHLFCCGQGDWDGLWYNWSTERSESMRAKSLQTLRLVPLIAGTECSPHSVPGTAPSLGPCFLSAPAAWKGNSVRRSSIKLFDESFWALLHGRFHPSMEGKRKREIKLKCKSVKSLDPAHPFFLIRSKMRGEF